MEKVYRELERLNKNDLVIMNVLCSQSFLKKNYWQRNAAEMRRDPNYEREPIGSLQ